MNRNRIFRSVFPVNQNNVFVSNIRIYSDVYMEDVIIFIRVLYKDGIEKEWRFTNQIPLTFSNRLYSSAVLALERVLGTESSSADDGFVLSYDKGIRLVEIGCIFQRSTPAKVDIKASVGRPSYFPPTFQAYQNPLPYSPELVTIEGKYSPFTGLVQREEHKSYPRDYRLEKRDLYMEQ